ncbi:MAG: flagellar hook protein FlgE [Succinivibrio sp.]
MFNTSISGLNGAQKYLDTTSNNIANSNSYGFKKSRAEFADLYCNSVFTSSKTATGMGTTTTNVAQQFTQGSLSGDTGNNLDMAISGNGFFVLANEANDNGSNIGDRTYTRNGAFQLNEDGYITTAMGDFVQGYSVDAEGKTSNLDISSTTAIRIPSTTGAPKQTSKLGMTVNLPANSETLYDEVNTKSALQQFDPKDSTTYTAATSQTVYDSLGGAHTLTYYFLKDHVNDGGPAATGTDAEKTNGHSFWNVVCMMGDTQVDIAGGIPVTVNEGSSSYNGQTFYAIQLEFGTDGQLIAQTGEGGNEIGLNLTNNNSASYPPDTGRAAYTLAAAMGGGVDSSQEVFVDLEYTQYGSSKFSIGNLTNDGYSTGVLENVEVDEDGLIMASYTNGRQVPIAKLAMAYFTNPQGLTKIGDTQWKESIHSGPVQSCEANTGMVGAVKGANLELSNVELASELVDLIIAQRSYQANAQALQTQNTAMDSIMNIR